MLHQGERHCKAHRFHSSPGSIQEGVWTPFKRGSGLHSRGGLDSIQLHSRGGLDSIQEGVWTPSKRGSGLHSRGGLDSIQEGVWTPFKRGSRLHSRGGLDSIQEGVWTPFKRGSGLHSRGGLETRHSGQSSVQLVCILLSHGEGGLSVKGQGSGDKTFNKPELHPSFF